jgi:pimeloyl-ACP methyl ester carboxylesterase
VKRFVGTRSMFRPVRKPITDADLKEARARLPLLEETSFRSEDGLLLRGYYLPSRNGAVVVMGHGLGENCFRFLPVVEILARHGYGSLIFSWRAHGNSEGTVSTWSDREQHDFKAAIDEAVRRPDVEGGRVAGLGFSIGASTVALEAAQDSRVRAVVLEAVFTSFDEELRDKMGKRGPVLLWISQAAARLGGVDFDHIRPIDHVAAIAPRPILFIAGSRDSDTPEPIVRRVFAAARDPKELWVAEGAEHGEYRQVAPVDYERVLVGFLDGAFFGGAAKPP